jgi:hypothetical protein
VPAAPGCWQVFGEVQADELQRFGHPPVHGLVVDAYMAQHPGEGQDRRDRQSVFVHLAGLYARLEMGLPVSSATGVLRRLSNGNTDFPVLHREPDPGELNVLHLVGSRDQADYERRAREWAQAVWQAWSSHHCEIAAAVREIAGT